MAGAGRSSQADTAAAAAAAAHLVWFRPGDLRLADHEPLHTAASWLQIQRASQEPLLLPFFCLDERQLAAAPRSLLGLPQLGPHRLRLLLEACARLRAALQALDSELLWLAGRPEAAVGRLVALAAAAGSRAVVLHHYAQPGKRQSAELEDGVAAAVAAAAEAHGLPCTIHRYWGHTLYHPADLPYHLWGGSSTAAAGVAGRGGSGGISIGSGSSGLQAESKPGAAPSGAAEEPAAGAEGAAAGAAAAAGRQCGLPPTGGPDCGWVSRQTAWLGELPLGVMSDFRRALQAHTPVRPPLPAPVSAATAGSCTSSSGGAGGGGAPALPPLPPDVAAQARKQGLLGPLPTVPAAVYAAAGPEAQQALQRLEALVGTSFSDLQPAGSGSWDERCAVPLSMGEQQGLQRLRYYLGLEPSDGHSTRAAGPPPPIAGYAEARMGPWGVDSSAKLSPFLSLGCLSPRTIYWEVLHLAAAEQAAGADASTAAAAAAEAAAGAARGAAAGSAAAGSAAGGASAAAAGPPAWREPQKGDTWQWLLMHLGIRDWFVFSAMRNEAALERAEGMSAGAAEWRQDADLFQRWARGQTGLPFVDASMRELAATGWMSNRGRQNVANLLTKALHLDWRLGAELFAALLLDHDWTLNTANWAYNSGVGADPRGRVFRSVTQGQRYDPEARLIKAWLPELAGLPADLAHQPWAASPDQLAAAGLRLGEPQAAREAVETEGEAAAAAEAKAAAAVAKTAAAAAAAAGGEPHHYPLPAVDPATQVGKGPKVRR